MKKMDLKKRFLAFMTTLVMIGSEIGSSGMTIYAAEPDVAVVSADAAEEEEVSENGVSENGVSENDIPEADEKEDTVPDDSDPDFATYRFDLAEGEESRMSIKASVSEEEVPEEEDVNDISYTRTVYASDLEERGKLELTANTILVVDTDRQLANITGKDRLRLQLRES